LRFIESEHDAFWDKVPLKDKFIDDFTLEVLDYSLNFNPQLIPERGAPLSSSRLKREFGQGLFISAGIIGLTFG